MPRYSDSEDERDDEFYSYQDYCNRRRRPVVSTRFVFFFLCATLASAVVLELLPFKILHSNMSLRSLLKKTTDQHFLKQPTYAIYSNSPKEDHLVHVKNVLSYLGYRRVPFDDDWDLLWAHDYPYLRLPERMKNLKPHQMVNHLPGCGFLTNKVDLCTTSLPFLPKAFRLPTEQTEFLEYAMNNLGALFVEKNNQHRLIAIRSPNEINLNSNDSFVQEYIQNPFLVNGYKFDIGAYVVITSVNPLRAYIYKGDILFRYCSQKYHPFDPSNVDKYVVGDDYLPTWKVPSLKKYYTRYSGSMRASFDAYVRDQSLDPSGIWTQVEDIIRRTILTKEQDIARLLSSYKTQKFFELMRFDLIIDKDLKVILMEANMSPNLSSAHFKPNSLLYEQILYSALNLVGIGSPIKHTTKDRCEDMTQMLASEKNLAVDLNTCVENNCDTSCNIEECSLCLPCITGTEYKILEKAHEEHLHKMDMKRIFPKPILDLATYDLQKEIGNMTKTNAWLTKWFYEKCKFDQSWCG